MLGEDSSTYLGATTSTSAGSGAGGSGSGSEAVPLIGALKIGEVGVGSGDEERARGDEGDRGFGGNRWPRQETLALLKIRSEMDVGFRDTSSKGPLWDEVSRKLAKLGYNRSSKKCKEKFENVYKYHKRTKEGRVGKHEGKTYRFFDQLEAFENHPSSPSLRSFATQSARPHNPAMAMSGIPISFPLLHHLVPQSITAAPYTVGAAHHFTVSSAPATTLAASLSQGIAAPVMNLTVPSVFPTTDPTVLPTSPPVGLADPSSSNIPSSFPDFSPDLMSNSTSSSTSSDPQLEGRNKRKRKWKGFFERLMVEVIERQEEMQRKFLEAIGKHEQERMTREESWRMQEMERINRERECLAQERSIAVAKDAAVMAFLQKLSEQQNPELVQKFVLQSLDSPAPATTPPPPPPPAQPVPTVIPTPTQTLTSLPPRSGERTPATQPAATGLEITKSDNLSRNIFPAGSSRWPKAEVQALIGLRTSLDSKYQESGPKGPLWEEISASMRKLGYSRSSKRCKEKWENINKYFKKVKESNKKRPVDSKTCPYFHQLDALYKEKKINKTDDSSNSQLESERSVPLIVRPEQQWPPLPPPPPPPEPPRPLSAPHSATDDLESEDNQNDDKDFDDEEEEDGGSGYEIVANRPHL